LFDNLLSVTVLVHVVMFFVAFFLLSGAFWRRHLLLLCYDVSYSIPSLFVPFSNTYKLFFNALDMSCFGCNVIGFCKTWFVGVVEADVIPKLLRRRNTRSSVSCQVGLYVRFRV
jgi:hypothetical protein